MARVRVALAAVVLAVSVAVPAQAVEAGKKPRSIYHSKLLWATVNVCDTPGHPDAFGIRGSMPGSGYADETMYMRFRVQYRKRSVRRWHNIRSGGDSGWVEVGSARIRRREAGRTFTITPPRRGAYRLRGVVTFEWRRDGEVVRRARKRTTRGHKARGADPTGYSVASCVLR